MLHLQCNSLSRFTLNIKNIYIRIHIYMYLLHFSPKPLLTEIQHYNIINIIIGICFPFNYIISTVKSWLEVVIYFDICVCVMCTDGQYCLMYIETKLNYIETIHFVRQVFLQLGSFGALLPLRYVPWCRPFVLCQNVTIISRLQAWNDQWCYQTR